MQLLNLAKTETENPPRPLPRSGSITTVNQPIGQDEVAQVPDVPHLILSAWPAVVPLVEGKIHMASRRQVTNKLRAQYREASRADKSKILDQVVATTGMARSTARRMLTFPDIERPRIPDPGVTRPGIEEPDIARPGVEQAYIATAGARGPGTAGQRGQVVAHVLGDIDHRNIDPLRNRVGARNDGQGLTTLLQSGPNALAVLGATPETYRTASHERGTGTSTSTRPGTTTDIDSASTDSDHLIRQELTTLALNSTISRAHSTFKCAAALDMIRSTQVTGWCVDADSPADACVIHLRLGGVRIASTTTLLPRPDVCRSLGFDATPGFTFNLTEPRIRRAAIEALAKFASCGSSRGEAIELDAELETESPDHVMLIRHSNPTESTRPLDAWLDLLSADMESLEHIHKNRASVTGITPVPKDGQQPIVAYYLPQFHSIPENDSWWGPGYTEWTTIAAHQKQFPTHDAPNMPADLGFYDLRVTESRAKQADLARQYGIYGFCYHFYWFGGKTLLEEPLNRMLKDGQPDLPYCLCWANEPWTRHWDGSDSDVLAEQPHDAETDVHILDDIERHFLSDRYIKIDGKPLLVVYRMDIMKNPREWTERMREEVCRRGWPGIYICGASTFANTDTRIHGCDLSVEFPPHNIAAQPLSPKTLGATDDFVGKIYDYSDLVLRELTRPARPYPLIPAVMPRWDNTPRKAESGHVFHGATPALFEVWLRHALSAAASQLPEMPFVFINSWNEWGEGAHLEPDRRYGRSFLEAVRRSVSRDNRPMPNHSRYNGSVPAGGVTLALDSPSLEMKLIAKRLQEIHGFYGPQRFRLVRGRIDTLRDIDMIEVARACHIDLVNSLENPIVVHVDKSHGLTIDGWILSDAPYSSEPCPLGYVELIRKQDRLGYFIPVIQRKPRPDVALEYGLQYDGSQLGFFIYASLSDVEPGFYSIRITEIVCGVAYRKDSGVAIEVL